MRKAIALLCSGLVLGLAVSAFAADPFSNLQGNPTEEEKNAALVQIPGIPSLVGGDTFGTAPTIPSLPYTDTGNTCGYADDYYYYAPSSGCPYSATGGPDVVYKYLPTTTQNLRISLCSGTDYDSKLQVYQNTVAGIIGCNDDFCGLVSQLDVTVTAGNTYYIVVDGWSTSCGNYTLTVAELVPCVVTCPPNSQLEGEPVCYDGYTDNYNGGCNSTPYVFSPVTCNTICGNAGYYTTGGLGLRDTDWYALTLEAPCSGTVTVVAEFPVQLAVIVAPCPPTTIPCNLLSPECVPVSCAITGPGSYYVFVAPQQGLGTLACGKDYVLTFSGCSIPPCGPTSTESSTWGRVKGLFNN